VPGTTARYFTATQLLEIDQRASNYNRPYSDATFVGGVTLEDRQGLFVIDWTEATPDRRTAPLRALKSAFFFDDQIVMLGSGIRDGDGAHAVGTTLFQTALGDGRAPTQAQGETVTGIDAKERVFDRGAVRLVDAAGNGYFVPAGQRTVLTRREQVSLNSAGTKESRGAYATAWLDHGASPADAGYEYVILVRAGEQGLARFAQQAADEYEVRRKDAVAHIVRQKRLGITGFAIAKARAALGDALVREADVPCLVMARDTGGGAVVMSVANPDFGWQKGVQYAAKGKGPGADPMKPVPTPVTLTLAGGWTVQGAARGIVTVRQDDRTLITIPCADATSVGFTLSPAKP
jgi:chondroitin-sulfate-ABC endolyase/exolyase